MCSILKGRFILKIVNIKLNGVLVYNTERVDITKLQNIKKGADSNVDGTKRGK